MRIAFITSGAAGMYCGSCMRDNALATALKRQGHHVTLIPLFTPLRTEPQDVSITNRWPGTVAEIIARDGPYADVRVDLGGFGLWALVTRASVERLALEIGAPAWCLVKTVALDARTLGYGEQPQLAEDR